MIFLKFKGIRNDLDRPRGKWSLLAGLEAQVEVTWELGVDAKGIHAASRVCLRVGGKPLLWSLLLAEQIFFWFEEAGLTGLRLAATLVFLVSHHLIHLLRHSLDVKHDQLIKIAVCVLSTNL